MSELKTKLGNELTDDEILMLTFGERKRLYISPYPNMSIKDAYRANTIALLDKINRKY